MRTRSVGGILGLALATGLLGGIVASCSSDHNRVEEGQNQPERIGAIQLELEISEGVIVNLVSYRVTGPGLSTPIMGTIDVSQEGSTVSARIGQLPVGEGFVIELIAESTDGLTNCVGSATFDVEAGATTLVPVTLECRAEDNTGAAQVDVTFNTCPVIDELIAAPTTAGPGAVVTLTSAASDADEDTLSYSWMASAPGGAFTGNMSADATYMCNAGGDFTLTISVSDGQCTSTRSVDITCAVLFCGNGALDAGETCDDSNRVDCDACNSNCQTEACGNGRLECSEVCDDGNTASGDGCGPTCLVEMPGCGNGLPDPGEACDFGEDPPVSCSPDNCSETCQVETCGNGIVECGEQCDDGNTDGGDCCSPTCTDTPPPPNACQACEQASCADRVADVVSPPRGLPGDAALASDLLACIHSTNCAAPPAAIDACYCGTAPIAACLVGAGNGPCKAQTEAAAGTTDPIAISELFGDPSVPIGNAYRLVACDRQFCSSISVPPNNQCFPYPAGLTCP